eukprot:COSAG06_NODE_44312_length_364_cov_1.166038_1_plen_43_part_10
MSRDFKCLINRTNQLNTLFATSQGNEPKPSWVMADIEEGYEDF